MNTGECSLFDPTEDLPAGLVKCFKPDDSRDTHAHLTLNWESIAPVLREAETYSDFPFALQLGGMSQDGRIDRFIRAESTQPMTPLFRL